ncbi:unnamed protein product [Arabis nemorensis]|uniref:Thioredoxin domain-containing protein n=1 Tax=Arabis nemorensis TaxID=586526 RepID=A0A565CDE1_9BRAS|nr:unnamed protein product [Arabis nemorensis]
MAEEVPLEPAIIAHGAFPESQCSLWGCRRRVHFASAPYCCGVHCLAALDNSLLQSPLMFSYKYEILQLENSICLKTLDTFKSNVNPGIPDIVTNLLENYPWLQPDRFGLKLFKREKFRGWIFVNPYDVHKAQDSIWKHGYVVRKNNMECTRFTPNFPQDPNIAKLWVLYRYSIVVEGDVKKGLFIMLYKPKTIAIAECEMLAPLTTERSVTILTADTFDGTVFDAEKYALVMVFKPGCNLCNTLAQTYKKVAAVFHNYDHLVLASIDVSADRHIEICTELGVKTYPAVMFFHESAGEVIENGWLFDLEDFISLIKVRIGLQRIVNEVQHPPADGVEHFDPSAVAVSQYPETECSLWDCKRRVPTETGVYCCEDDRIIAERDIPPGGRTIWMESYSKQILNAERTTFRLNFPDNAEYSNKTWSLYRYSVVVEGDVKKGLFLMCCEPKVISYLTGDTARLAPFTTGDNVDVLTDESFEDMVSRDKDVLIMFFKPGCNLCNECGEKVGTAFKDEASLAFASFDMSVPEHIEICNEFNVTHHPTLLLVSESLVEAKSFQNVKDFLGFICDKVGPKPI